MTAWLAHAGMSRTYWPERLEIAPDMRRTASGKSQKFELRERAKGLGG